MDDNVKLLAKQAGFVFWDDEDWKTNDETIDWSNNYDNELQRFYELVVAENAVSALTILDLISAKK